MNEEKTPYLWSTQDDLRSAVNNVSAAADALQEAVLGMRESMDSFDYPPDLDVDDFVKSIEEVGDQAAQLEAAGTMKVAAFGDTLIDQEDL